jgi:hypothetical protein
MTPVVAVSEKAALSESMIQMVTLAGLALGSILAIWGAVVMARESQARQTEGLPPDAAETGSGVAGYAVSQLNKNNQILRNQTTSGFYVSSVLIILGTLTVLAGAFGSILGFGASAGTLSTVAGVIADFIGATSLVLYRMNFSRLNKTTDNLNYALQIQTAAKLAEGLPPQERASATLLLIRQLMVPTTGTRSLAFQDMMEAVKEPEPTNAGGA